MQVGNPIELTVQWCIQAENNAELESYIHEKYERHRVRGEWFRLTDKQLSDILHYIADNLKGSFLLQESSSKTEDFAIAIFNEMYEYGHITQDSNVLKINGVWTIRDIKKGVTICLSDIDIWIAEGYSVEEVIMELGFMHK